MSLPRARSIAAFALWLAILACPLVGRAQAPSEKSAISLDELRTARKQLAQRPRRIIFNNDGCDCLYFPRDQKVTVEGFLEKRTSPLAGSQVDAISYCSISSGFSNFTHKTQVGTVLAKSASEFGIHPEMKNITQELIDGGTDCLQAVLNFTRRQKMECFWSMRMNDTHDAEHRPDRPYFLFPPLKVAHPDWLVGEPVKRTPFGRWSSVDYARPEIRDLAAKYIEEVCRNYDVDGVELDYFRHLCYFKSVAKGGAASDAERQMMTDLMRRVRRTTEEIGCRRGRPILILVRTPDSLEYCRDMGFDLEVWLREGLCDLLVTTCYFQLNPWQYTVALGHKYGVPVYAGLSEARIIGQNRFNRDQIECYRGRALNAWAAGVDGIYLFNYFNPKGAPFRELGDPAPLRNMKRLYFVTVRDGGPQRFLAKGERFQTIPILTPAHPAPITAAAPLETTLTVGDKVAQSLAVQCHLYLPGLQSAEQVEVQLAGQTLGGGRVSKGWLDLDVPSNVLKPGENRLRAAVNPNFKPAADAWNVAYEARRLPASPWRSDRRSPRTEAKLTKGALLVADRGKEGGDYLYYRWPWGADPSEELVMEVKLKVRSGGNYLMFSNGKAQARLGFWPDHLDFFHNKKLRSAIDAAGDFHVYRVVAKGADVKVFVDGQLRLDGKGAFHPVSTEMRNEVAFGAANSPEMGEAEWAYVKARTSGLVCYDALVSAGPKK